ncbi:MAG TPA: BlaI/MecI/CopY family transcriptional regulator [Pirellulales bacterium]|jgi:BlaI family penicillinase repressor|nr:BlaI/MecI/CopY family transcriptional regulator [Pirellulales bacterium]
MPKLPTLQLAIMQSLWRRGQATVAEVQSDLSSDRRLAYTTVATMLTKMERKELVEHQREGRTFIYRPLVDEQRVSRSMVADLAERLFGGSVTALVSHLLDECDVEPAELARLKSLIAQKEKERNRGRK